MVVPADRVFLTRKNAAKYLAARGIEIKPETLARWQSTGRYGLPLLKIGRLVRYDREDLDRFVEQHRVNPVVAR